MPLPNAMRKVVPRTPGVTVNVDYVDIATGTGYEIFYAGNAEMGSRPSASSCSYVLSPNQFYSNSRYLQGNLNDNGGAWQKELDIDYDVEINLPRVLNGVPIINVPLALRNAQTTGSSKGYVYAKLRKYDGTTETEIVSASSSVLDNPTTGAANTYKDKLFCMNLPEINMQTLKQGEVLRLTLEAWGWMTDTKQGDIYLGNDPMNRVEATIFAVDDMTQTTIHLPYKVDVTT